MGEFLFEREVERYFGSDYLNVRDFLPDILVNRGGLDLICLFLHNSHPNKT